jgi:putative DNA primase/helicase
MLEEDNIRAVRFDYLKSVIPKPMATSWDQLSTLLMRSKETKRKDHRALWSPVIYQPGTTRGNQNVAAITCLVVDMDGEAFDYARLDGLEYHAYTTWSHRPNEPHWHLVLPLKNPVPADKWLTVWTRLHEKINVVGDPATKDPARIFYLPQHGVGNLPGRIIQHGERLDAELTSVLELPTEFTAPTMQQVKARHGKTSRPRVVLPNAANPSWWNQDDENDPYAGMTEQEALRQFAKDWQELRKVLLSAE